LWLFAFHFISEAVPMATTLDKIDCLRENHPEKARAFERKLSMTQRTMIQMIGLPSSQILRTLSSQPDVDPTKPIKDEFTRLWRQIRVTLDECLHEWVLDHFRQGNVVQTKLTEGPKGDKEVFEWFTPAIEGVSAEQDEIIRILNML